MGLDMYLYTASEKLAKKSAEWHKERGYWNDDFVSFYSCNGIVAYWRKVNPVHGWFVENIQGGEDNCGIYDVYLENMKDLRDACEKALDERDPDILPCVQGFFFGSDEYDEWLWDSIKYTYDVLGFLLDNLEEKPYDGGWGGCLMFPEDDNWDARIQYRSSW